MAAEFSCIDFIFLAPPLSTQPLDSLLIVNYSQLFMHIWAGSAIFSTAFQQSHVWLGLVHQHHRQPIACPEEVSVLWSSSYWDLHFNNLDLTLLVLQAEAAGATGARKSIVVLLPAWKKKELLKPKRQRWECRLSWLAYCLYLCWQKLDPMGTYTSYLLCKGHLNL